MQIDEMDTSASRLTRSKRDHAMFDGIARPPARASRRPARRCARRRVRRLRSSWRSRPCCPPLSPRLRTRGGWKR
eukprot:4033343-Pleurochrysis_carterae.AAC.2